MGISRPSGYAAAAGGFPLVICVIAEQILFGRGLCVGGVSLPVSVCGLYVRYIEASLPLALGPYKILLPIFFIAIKGGVGKIYCAIL